MRKRSLSGERIVTHGPLVIIFQPLLYQTSVISKSQTKHSGALEFEIVRVDCICFIWVLFNAVWMRDYSIHKNNTSRKKKTEKSAYGMNVWIAHIAY